MTFMIVIVCAKNLYFFYQGNTLIKYVNQSRNCSASMVSLFIELLKEVI